MNRVQNFRKAERRLWQHYGLQPKEYFLELERPQVRVRVQEVGEGAPVLFVHGSPNAGATWAPLVAQMENFCCLMLDRPGCGLSESVDYDAYEVREWGVDLLESVLTALEIEQVSLVASSAGGSLAYLLAQERPGRVSRMVQLGCPGLVEGMNVPFISRLMAVPRLNRLMVRMMPSNLNAVRDLIRQIGHGPGLEEGRIPEVLLEWVYHLLEHTDTMENELAMMEKVMTWRGIRKELMFRESELRRISAPTLYIWNEGDPFGGSAIARQTAASTPNAQLHLFPESGHLPWIDNPGKVASLTADFLQAGAQSPDEPHLATAGLNATS